MPISHPLNASELPKGLRDRVDEIVDPLRGILTQGTIFNCVRIDGYDGCAAYGLVITARCDAVNGKVKAYNYLPIVTLNDWLQRDGLVLIAERFRSDAIGSLKSALHDGGYSSSVLETETLDRIKSTLFLAGNKKVNQAKTRFEEWCERLELAESVIRAPQCSHVPLLGKAAAARKDGLIQELLAYKLAGYYFLQRIEKGGSDLGYVVLLRDIQIMSCSAASAIIKGMDNAEFGELCRMDPLLISRISVGSDDYLLPMGMLSSPKIEHLMQAFSLTFTRIGIQNIEPAYAQSIWSRQSCTTEVR